MVNDPTKTTDDERRQVRNIRVLSPKRSSVGSTFFCSRSQFLVFFTTSVLVVAPDSAPLSA